MDQLQCPHCMSLHFEVNPLFLECQNCGTRFVMGSNGKLQRTEAFGTGHPHDKSTFAITQNKDPLAQQPGPDTHYHITINTVTVKRKSRIIAFLLAFFFGMLGAHYFYLNRWGWGLLYFFTAGILGVGWIVDIVRVGLNKIPDSNGNLPA